MTKRTGAVFAAHEEEAGEGIDRRRTVLTPHPTDHDPILLWGEDWFRRGAFDWHPHRGFETVSYVHSGAMDIADSTGARGTLREGDVQWTTAGSGFFHDGQPIGDTVTHGMQLWLNLPQAKRMSPPREQVVRAQDAPTCTADGWAFRVFGGTCNDVTGPIELLHPALFVVARHRSGQAEIHVPARHAGCMYSLEGTARIDGTLVPEGHGVAVDPGDELIHLESVEPGTLLLAAGDPIKEPTVMEGPFVMSSEEEIVQAYADLESGKLGSPPRVPEGFSMTVNHGV